MACIQCVSSFFSSRKDVFGNLLSNSKSFPPSGPRDSARRAAGSIPRSPSIFKLQSESSVLGVLPSRRAAARTLPLPAANLDHCFCYSLFVVPSNGETYVYPTQSQDTALPPLPFRSHFRRRVSFPPRRFSPVLAGMGLHGSVVPPHAGYLGLFPEARSPTG